MSPIQPVLGEDMVQWSIGKTSLWRDIHHLILPLLVEVEKERNPKKLQKKRKKTKPSFAGL